MRLIKVGCSGFKRFRERVEMDVDEKVIAIVGPNEAGKSSFLEALGYFELEGAFPDKVRTRGTKLQPKVWARYVLDDDDKAALASVPEAANVRQLVLLKAVDEKYELEDDVVRDITPRKEALRLVDRALERRWMKERESDDEFLVLMQRVRQILTSDDEDLAHEEVAELDQLRKELSETELPSVLKRLPEVVARAHTNDAKENPWFSAVEILKARRPRFLPFGSDARDLRSSYSFDEAPNTALENLLALAGTDWASLRRAADDAGALEGLLDQVREKLDQTFAAWKQSRRTVRITVKDNSLAVLVKMATRSDYLGIEERSDGLRQFVALRAHVASHTHGVNRPILLVDEADIHLHYDAQADLIQVLESQEEAAKVIYTTHSAGCLPQDLGRGVRIIVPAYRIEGDRTRETDDSRVINWFWTDEIEGTGFSPLLIGMGASTLAFSSTRRAVIAEGPADAILLPTIIRESAQLDRLGYQIAPGLANVDKCAAQELDLVAARVVYLLDGDEAGDSKEKLLEDAQIPRERILRLGSRRSKIVLEDLVAADVYLDAVNRELSRWHDVKMPLKALSSALRPRSVEIWCTSQTPPIQCPSKRAVAQHILELAKDRSIVAPRRREQVGKLHEAIEVLLSQPSHINQSAGED
jgi:predicted ATP-dependent endonuclease of OLD family